jgi:hypothetical protein
MFTCGPLTLYRLRRVPFTVERKGRDVMKSYLLRVVVEPDEDVWRAYVPALEDKGAATWGHTEQKIGHPEGRKSDTQETVRQEKVDINVNVDRHSRNRSERHASHKRN